MVIDVLSKPGNGGLRFALNFIEDVISETASVKEMAKQTSRPWCLIETSATERIYLPALSPIFRKAAASGRLLWIQSSEALAPSIAQTVLESGLCSGVALNGVEKFPRTQKAGLWGRRWQLASKKGDTHLIWVHKKPHAAIGFDVRVEFNDTGRFEIKRGYGYFHEQRFKKALIAQSPAA